MTPAAPPRPPPVLADLVPAGRRATAYGVFAAVQGIGALAGGVLAGALLDGHVTLLAVVVGALQLAAAGLLWRSCNYLSMSLRDA
ncbi:hypothetical protein [Nocardioides sp. BYT-33-1]|uniref:hypothetical protein n=1 Tax=Nocardioides sp. BYT-33-1 TaxID=3416952 RepID=UPI003F53C078